MGCKKVLAAITGASGIIYGERLVEVLYSMGLLDGVIVSSAALNVARIELGRELRIPDDILVFKDSDFSSPYASSSGLPDCMAIVPASMNTIAKIAWGVSDNIVARAALGMLRLRRKLVLAPRESPLGVVELENLVKLAKSGAIIVPACPGFYTRPRSINDLIDFVVGKILDSLVIENTLYKRWGRGN